MKKIYAILTGVLMAGTAFGQRTAGESTIVSETAPYLFRTNNAELVVDTISPIIVCSTPSAFLVQSQNGGYISGTNGYQDAQKGIINAINGTARITDLLVFFGAKEQVSNGNLYAHVFNFDTTQTTLNAALGSSLGTSAAVSVSSVDTTGFTAFHFNNGVIINDVFAVTVDVDNGSDTVGILHTDDQCGSSLAIEQWSDGDWYQMADGTNSWGMDITFYMFVVVDDNISTEENILDKQSARAFPNPANDNINITYHLNGSSEVVINVMDIQGRVVMTKTENQIEGRQFVEMNTSALSAGTYFYNVQSGSNVMSGKFVVRH